MRPTDRRAAQQHDAARALHQEGRFVFAIEHLIECASAYEALADGDAARVSRLVEARKRLEALRELPDRAHGEVSAVAWAALDRAIVGMRAPSAPPARWRVIAGVVGALFAFWLGARAVSATTEHEPLQASGEINAQHNSAKARDGDHRTEWQLPDLRAGTLELNFDPRRVESVRIVNGRNPPWLDRAVREYRLRVYRAGELVHDSRGALEAPRAPRAPPTVPIGREADRVRFDVVSWYGTGAGLAELEVL